MTITVDVGTQTVQGLRELAAGTTSLVANVVYPAAMERVQADLYGHLVGMVGGVTLLIYGCALYWRWRHDEARAVGSFFLVGGTGLALLLANMYLYVTTKMTLTWYAIGLIRGLK